MFNENDIDNELMSVFGQMILQLGQWVNLENSSVWPKKTMMQICRELHFSQKDFINRFIQFTDNVIANHKKT